MAQRIHAYVGKRLSLLMFALAFVLIASLVWLYIKIGSQNSQDFKVVCENIFRTRNNSMESLIQSLSCGNDIANYVVHKDSTWAINNLCGLENTFHFTGLSVFDLDKEIFSTPKNGDYEMLLKSIDNQMIAAKASEGQLLSFYVKSSERIYKVMVKKIVTENNSLTSGNLLLYNRLDQNFLDSLGVMLACEMKFILPTDSVAIASEDENHILIALDGVDNKPISYVFVTCNNIVSSIKSYLINVVVIFLILIVLVWFFMQATMHIGILEPLWKMMAALDNDVDVKLGRKYTQEIERLGNLVNVNRQQRAELKSKNEEMITLEEELRQNNEELQSTNDLLYENNNKLEAKNDEINRINSELNKSAAFLKEQENYLSAILANLGEGFLIVDTDFMIVMANEACKKMFNLPDDLDKVRNSILDKIVLDYRQLFIDKSIGVRKNGNTERYEIVGVGLDGQKHDYKITQSLHSDSKKNVSEFLIVISDVTAAHRQQEMINDQNKKLNKYFTAISQNPDIIIITDIDGYVEYVNPTFEKITGYSFDEVRSSSLQFLLNGSTAAILYKKLWETIRIGNQWHGEIENKRKDGSVFIGKIIVSPIKDSGRIIGYLFIMEDVTESRYMQKQLVESQRSYEMIAENSSDVIWLFDIINNRMTYISPSVKAMRGFSAKEAVNMRLEDFFAKLTLQKLDMFKNTALINQMLVDGRLKDEMHFEVQQITKDGSYIDVEIQLTPLYKDNDKTKFIEQVMGVNRNITQRKQSELVLKKSEQKQKKNNQLLKILIDNLPARIYLKDSNLRYQLVNKQFANSMGYGIKEMLGKTDEELNALYSKEYGLLDQKVLQTMKPILNYEKMLSSDEDGILWTTTSKVPYISDDNKIEGIIGIVEDITRRKLNEQMILDRTRQFENTIKSLTDVYVKTDLSGIIMQVSPSVCSFYGCENVTDVIGHNSFDVLDAETADSIKEALLSKGQLKGFGFKFINKNNEERYGEGNFVMWYDELDMPAGFEGIVRDMTDRMRYEKMLNNMSKDLMNTLKTVEHQKQAIEENHKSMLESINYAKRIQNSLQPDEKNINQFITDSFLIYKPCEIVGGDCYYVGRKGGKTIVAVADCTGHGIPGALMSVLAISSLNNVIVQMDRHNISASAILEALRYKMINTMNKSLVIKDGLDICLIIFDNNSSTLEYAGANNPLFIVRNGELIVLEPTKCPVGLYPVKLDFKDNVFEYQPNDSLFLISDGYQDQFGGPDNRKFTRKALKSLFCEIGSLTTEQQKQVLAETLQEWMDAQPSVRQVDDITVLGVKITPDGKF